MKDNFFLVSTNCDLANKLAVYTYITEQIESRDKEELLQLFFAREQIGSTLIADQIVLPHLQSSMIDKSQIVFITFKKPIEWDAETGRVKMVIAIVLKKDETKKMKEKISLFTRTLADENYLQELADESDQNLFLTKIKEK